MPRIGPFTFTLLRGRMLTASAPVITTARGVRPAPPRSVISRLATAEDHATHAAAWQRAWAYRQVIGSVTDVVDDGDGLCPTAVIVDVRTRVDHASSGGATLTVVWSLVAGQDFGVLGQQILAGETNAIQPIVVRNPTVQTGTVYQVGAILPVAMTGDFQWPLPVGADGKVRSALKAVGANIDATPSRGGGSLSLWTYEADYTACFRQMDTVRLMAGVPQDLVIGAIRLPQCPVIEATPSWTEGTGLPSGKSYIFSADVSIDIQDESIDDGDRPINDCVIEVASAWGSWQRLKAASCEEYSEGCGPAVGSCSVHLDLSPTVRGRSTRTDLPVDHSGKWVRLRLADPKVNGNPAEWQIGDAVWWGVILSQTDQAGSDNVASATLTCAGIGAVLQQTELYAWWHTGFVRDGTAVDVRIDPVPPFNDVPAGDHAAGAAIADVHSLDAVTPTRWTALEICTAILAEVNRQHPGGPTWVLGGQTGALGDDAPHDLRGATAFEMLTEILSPRRALTFRIEMSTDGSTATVRVLTTQPTAVSEPSIGIDVPANDRLTALVDMTLRDAKDYPSVEVIRDRSQEYDHILVEGGQPSTAVTLAFNATTTDIDRYALTKGWTAAQEATWLAASEEDRANPYLSHVWRRFVLRDNYSGNGYYHPSSNRALRMVRTTATDAAHGTDGETGALSDAGAFISSRALRFDRTLPIQEGIDWTTIYNFTPIGDPFSQVHRQVIGPIIFKRDETAGSLTRIDKTYAVTVEDDAPAILLGHGLDDAESIYAMLQGGFYSLMITIGIMHPMPWRVSWRRAPTARPRDRDRSITLRHPKESYRAIASGTVIGCDASGTPTQVTVAGGEDIAFLGWGVPNDPTRPRLDVLLRLHRMWYETGPRSATWEHRGSIDTDTALAPGSMVTALKYRLDRNRIFTNTINAQITGRTVRLRRGDRSTVYQAERMQIGTGYSVLAKAPQVAPNLAAAVGAGAYP